MADPKKNPLIGAFRTPAPGSTPVTSTEGEPKTAPPVQDTPPKAAEPPKDAVPKVKADATAHTTPGDVKKSQEPSDPEKPSTGEVAKSIDEKKGAEASKTPAEEKEPSDQDGDKSKGKSIDIVSQVPVDEIIAKSLFKIDEKDPSFKELVEDIRKNGMKVPINVNRTADGKYEVIDGNRRLAAAKKLGMKTINATIMNLPDRLLRKGQFHSNLAPRLILEAPGEGGDKSPQLLRQFGSLLAADFRQHQDVPFPIQPGPANVPAGDVPGEVLHQSRLHRVCQPAGGSPLPISPDSGSDICRKAFCPAQGAPPYARFPSRSPRPLKPASIRGRFRLYPRNSPYIISERL